MLAEEDVSMYKIFSLIAMITSIIGLSPQIYKTYITKSAHDLSYLMLYNFLLCSLAWVVHGIYENDIFVLISNIFGLLCCVISIIQKSIYDAK